VSLSLVVALVQVESLSQLLTDAHSHVHVHIQVFSE
jgi:hypothetical protein